MMAGRQTPSRPFVLGSTLTESGGRRMRHLWRKGPGARSARGGVLGCGPGFGGNIIETGSDSYRLAHTNAQQSGG